MKLRIGLAGVLAAPLLLAPAAPAGAVQDDCGQPVALHRNDFPAAPKVDNKFFPLIPGTKWVLKGTVDGEPHTVVTTVTDLTKVIDGVTTAVLLDEDFGPHRDLQEAELAFMAQDRQGTVWNLGEYPEEYENGVFTGAPSVWISGLAKARAGIGMLAVPAVGTAAYLQGFAPTIDFKDCAQSSRPASTSASRPAATTTSSSPTSSHRSTREAATTASSTHPTWASCGWTRSATRIRKSCNSTSSNTSARPVSPGPGPGRWHSTYTATR